MEIISTCSRLNLELGELSQTQTIEILKKQNTCLSDNVVALSQELGNQTQTIASLTNNVKTMDAKMIASIDGIKDGFNVFKQVNGDRFDAYQSTQIELLSHFEMMYGASLEHYGNWTVAISVILAAAGVFAFFSLRGYKKREVASVVDEAKDSVLKDIELKELTRQAVVSAFESDEVKQKLEHLQSELLADFDPLIRSIIEDHNKENGVLDKTLFETILNASDKGGRDE